MAAYWSDDPQGNDTTSLDSYGGEREEENLLSVQNPSRQQSEDSTESDSEDDVQCSSMPSSSQLLACHGSCPSDCKRRIFNAVIHHCPEDAEFARQVKKWLEQQKLTYCDEKFPVRISLLGDVTAKTDIESLNEICDKEMTTVFFILCTAKYKNHHGSHTVGLKITNIESKSQSFRAIELYIEDALMAGSSPELLQRVLYMPKEPAFQEKIRNILIGTSFHENIMHIKRRQSCEKGQIKKHFQRDCPRDKKNRKPSQKKRCSQPVQRKESTTESDDSFSPSHQTSSAGFGDRHRDSRVSDVGTAHLKQGASRSVKESSKPGTLQQPTSMGSLCNIRNTGNRASSQHASGKTKSDQTDKLQVDRADPEQHADDQHKTCHCLERNQSKIHQPKSQTMSCDSSSSDHTRKRQISHFRNPPGKSLNQNHASKSSTDLSEASSSSASEHLSGKREIKHDPLHQKHNIQQKNSKKEFNDHQYACSSRLRPSQQEHDNNDLTSPGGTSHGSHGRDSKGTSHDEQYPPRLPANSPTKPMAVVRPAPQNPSNNEEGEDEDDSEQTVRKTLHTSNTVQETPNVSSGSGAYDSREVLPGQPVPTTQVSATGDNSQPNSTASSGDFEAEGPSQAASLPAVETEGPLQAASLPAVETEGPLQAASLPAVETEGPSQAASLPAVETVTTDNDAEGGESGRRRPIRRVLSSFLRRRLSRFRSGLRSLSCSHPLQDRPGPHRDG